MFPVSAQWWEQEIIISSTSQDPAAYLEPAHLPGEAEVGLKGAGGCKRGSLGGSSETEGGPANTTDQYYAAQYDQYYRQAFNTNTDPGLAGEKSVMLCLTPA